MDFAPKPNAKISAKINEVIDRALEIENDKQEPRDYLGGSRLGVECLKALFYEYHNTPRDPGKGFKGRTLRRFRMGHWHEDETAEWFTMAGFDLRIARPDGSQFGFAVAQDPDSGRYRIKGHIDGCLVDGPVKLPYPLLWEHKIMKASKWREFVRDGVQKAFPVYYAQLQIYMAYMELHSALFVSVNTDTSELESELVEFNAADAQMYSDKGVKVIDANNEHELPRVTNDPANYKCKFCDWSARCWA